MCKISLWSATYILHKSVLNFHRISNSIEIWLVGRAPGADCRQILHKTHFIHGLTERIIHISVTFLLIFFFGIYWPNSWQSIGYQCITLINNPKSLQTYLKGQWCDNRKLSPVGLWNCELQRMIQGSVWNIGSCKAVLSEQFLVADGLLPSPTPLNWQTLPQSLLPFLSYR